MMRTLARRYGASPPHLVAVLAVLALTGYAGARLFAGDPLGVAAWFIGSAVAHDLVLFPLYAVVDGVLVRMLRRHPHAASYRGVAWINHIRFPAVISGLLLVVWAPLILRLPPGYQAITGLTTEAYLPRWLGVTATLFGFSASMYGIRVTRATHRAGD